VILLKDFEVQISQALSRELPGQQAQMKMMPSSSSNSRFSLDARKNAKPGAVMVLFYQENFELKFPLILRPDYDGVHARQISLPGGKMDPTDDSLIQTALRETEEEIGVRQDRIKVLGFLTELYIVASNFNVLPVVGILEDQPSFVPDSYEVDRIIKAKVSSLLNESIRKEKSMKIMQGITIKAPYYAIENQVVWGATSMILAELREVLKGFV